MPLTAQLRRLALYMVAVQTMEALYDPDSVRLDSIGTTQSSKMSSLSIEKSTGYDSERWTYIPVVVIGAGESGIAMGCRLKEVLGFDQFRIFDRQSGIGGVWWINRYPGVACDV